MQRIPEYTKLLEKALIDYSLPTEPAKLYEPISYILTLGGKRLRPAMCLAAAELFGGSVKDALNPALAVELFHNFSLIHDDIMDEADKRRGKPTVHIKWNSNVAILSGDAMLVKAYQELGKVNSSILPDALSLFSQTALEVCEGQQMDMDFEDRNDVSEEEYLEMIKLKTSVLLASSLKLGAICANAPKEDQLAIYNFGLNIGLAFQIQDDILDAYGDPEKFGKIVGGDIINDKKTLLMLHARKVASTEHLKELDALALNNQEPEAKVSRVLEIFEELKIKKFAEDKRNYYFEVSLKNLKSLHCSSPIINELEHFAAYLVHRDH